jgi:hypothetical protein
MTQSLSWKEKVVRKLTIIVSCLLISTFALAQATKPSAIDKTITLPQGVMRFDDLVSKLSGITGLNFIYSSNKIETGRNISISFRNNTLEEVFQALGNKMNLTFKRRDSYVIILRNAPKKAVASRPSSVQPQSAPSKFIAAPDSSEKSIVAFAAPSLKLTEDNGKFLSREYFKERLHHYFDTALLASVPMADLRKINVNNSHRGWFFSLGAAVNNYSVGPEMQFGVRSLYVTVGRRFLKTSTMTAYGLGTSFLLSHNLSLNPSYTYGVVRQNDLTVLGQKGIVFGNRLRVGEHQLKLMLQYAVDEKISFRLGPTFSHLVARRLDYFAQSMEFTTMVSAASPAGQTRFDYLSQPTQSAPAVKMLAIYTEDTYTRIGWEASLALRLNFFKRP